MQTRLKIAVYHNLHSGGAIRTLCAIAQRLSQRHSLDVYSLSVSEDSFCDINSFAKNVYRVSFSPLPEYRRPFGRLNYLARYLDLYRVERLQKKIAQDIDSRGYDLVFVEPCQYTQAPALLSYLHTPSLYHCHEPLRAGYEPVIERPYRTRKGIKKFLDNIDPTISLYRRHRLLIDRKNTLDARLVITNSYFTRESIYRIYGVNARVVYNGIDTGSFQPLDIPRTGEVVSVGACTPAKGFDFIIKSLARIPEAVRPGLVLISNYQEADEKAYLDNLARSTGVTVRFLCLVDNDTLVRTYNQTGLAVYAPVLEPFGLAPLEAMACGVPVVAVAEGGVRESIIHGETGLLVDRDSGQFAEAVQKLLANPALAREYGCKGRQHVLQNWTWDCAVQKIEDLFSAL